ncbi:hypothetical protein ACFPRL_03595 [Pseudoclavibacter helvolus]
MGCAALELREHHGVPRTSLDPRYSGAARNPQPGRAVHPLAEVPCR